MRVHQPGMHPSLHNPSVGSLPPKGKSIRSRVAKLNSLLYRFFIPILLLMRVGEAANPGPFVIGTFNPTGLLHKGEIMGDLPMGMWGVSESHLTGLGVTRFKEELSFAKCKHKFYTNVVAHHLSTSVGSIGGKAQGVGLLTSFPGRSLPVTWGKDVIDEARVYAGTAMISQQWIKMGVMYGYAFREKYVETQERSNKLLSHLVQRIVFDSKGPRVVCGDFNQEHGKLDQTAVLQQEGFVELQRFAKAAWGQDIQYTCKHSSTKDFVWISRELIPYLQQVVVDHSFFADHAIVYGIFKDLDSPKPIPIWPKPHELPWDQITFEADAEIVLQPHSGDPSVDLPNVMRGVENFVHHTLLKQNKQGLGPAHRGRSQRQKEQWCKHPSQPPKAGRQGDVNVQPEFCGENVTHNRWLRQLRRLVHLENLLTREDKSNILEQAFCVWESVKAAPGFPGGFRSFWVHQSSMAGLEPAVLPKVLPTCVLVKQIRVRFEQEFRAFEYSLQQARITKARQTRKDDNTKIYQDLKKTKAVAVQTLATKSTATVVWVADDGTMCQYEPHCFDIHEAVHTDFGLLQLGKHTHGQLEGLQDCKIEEGDLLYQDTWVSNQKDIFQAFEKLWLPMWQKHATTDNTKWIPFVEQCLEHIPSRDAVMEHSPITLSQWQKVVGHKKARSAMGPDGITRKDLLAMPIQAQKEIVRIVNDIERGSQWPQSCVLGLISSLQKHDRAKTAADYRPICVFSLIYRCWASYRAKEMLNWLAMISPPTLMGSCPGRDASMVWYQIAGLIEEGNLHDSSCAGLIADLTKCFNNLPRIPVMLLARKYGIPSQLCRTWQAAITAMPRRFLANGAVSGEHYSCNGFPEGDPLSVVAMMLINLAMNDYMTRWNPLAECWSYVDDWQVTAHDAQDIIQGFQGLQEFTALLDIPMDDDKSAVWSTGSGDRRDFRQEALPVAYHGRNLGGHLTYCKTITNYTIKSRIAKQTELWTWLTKSYAPSPQKVLALIVVAWPRCLHGISINVLGAKHFTKLRTKAVQCLGDHRKGTSPILHLSCIQNPKADPEFFAIWITIKHFRGYCNPQVAFPIIDFLLHHKPIQERSGPCSIFLFRINQLGWTWKEGGAIEDHEQMPLHITNDPIQLLWARAKHAWWARTLTIVSSRPGFSGLEHADVGTSVASLDNFTSDQKQLLVVAMNGSFYTRDKLFATGAFPDRQCPWCDATDSQFHRHWECPHHQNSRDQIPPAIFQKLEGQAECMLEHGWCQDSPARICFQQKLLQQPDLTEEFFVEPPDQDIQHLFTDGSCLASGCPDLRVATWGVVIAQLETDSFTPVAMGPLPGLYQTIFRAEATAYISACKFLLRHKIKGWIWSDNQQLVDFVKHAIIGCPIPNNKDPDHDILELVRQLTIRTHLNVNFCRG